MGSEVEGLNNTAVGHDSEQPLGFTSLFSIGVCLQGPQLMRHTETQQAGVKSLHRILIWSQSNSSDGKMAFPMETH